MGTQRFSPPPIAQPQANATHSRTHQSWDAFDFFTVSLTVTDLAKQFDRSKTDITWGITLVLMFRSVGSIIFGIAADRYGRKWPFIVNNVLFIVLELVSGSSPRTHPPCFLLLLLLYMYPGQFLHSYSYTSFLAPAVLYRHLLAWRVRQAALRCWALLA